MIDNRNSLKLLIPQHKAILLTVKLMITAEWHADVHFTTHTKSTKNGVMVVVTGEESLHLIGPFTPPHYILHL